MDKFDEQGMLFTVGVVIITSIILFYFYIKSKKKGGLHGRGKERRDSKEID